MQSQEGQKKYVLKWGSETWKFNFQNLQIYQIFLRYLVLIKIFQKKLKLYPNAAKGRHWPHYEKFVVKCESTTQKLTL